MAGRALRIKATAAVAALWVALALLTLRVGHLQIAQGEFYRHHAHRQQAVTRELSAPRGRIYDREGRLLSTSVLRNSVYVDPKGVAAPRRVVSLLSGVLDVSPETLRQKLSRDSYFAWVRRQIPGHLAARVRRLGLRGVHMRKESMRLYPHGSLAAHLIGFTDVDGRGLAGIERELDDLLRGRPGEEIVLRDGRQRIFRSAADRLRRLPSDGLDVYLTLDAYVQEIAEQELAAAVEKYAPECGTALVLNARDGSVLAAASWPGFDPNNPTAAPVSNQRNIAVSDAYEFGSVMKPFTVALALEAGVVEPSSEFDCHQGVWQIGGRTLHDAHSYGVLDVGEILLHSSNIGVAQISLALGAEALHEGIRQFGFGRPTGISLPGEAGGIVRPVAAWNRYSVVSVAFGQELAVTPLAVARAFAAFANDGFLVQPRIIQSVVERDSGRIVYGAGEAMLGQQAVSAPVAARVLSMLRRVVAEGTGRAAAVPGYAVAGKTGTAQLLTEDGTTYSDDRYLSSFCAVAPLPRPRVVCLVCLKAPSQNGYYGSIAAAPAVGNILRRTLRYLGVPTTAPPEPDTGEDT
ncbi:MAG: penicillin-binding protein 2 [Candidatus Brocadiia bacterium]